MSATKRSIGIEAHGLWRSGGCIEITLLMSAVTHEFADRKKLEKVIRDN